MTKRTINHEAATPGFAQPAENGWNDSVYRGPHAWPQPLPARTDGWMIASPTCLGDYEGGWDQFAALVRVRIDRRCGGGGHPRSTCDSSVGSRHNVAMNAGPPRGRLLMVFVRRLTSSEREHRRPSGTREPWTGSCGSFSLLSLSALSRCDCLSRCKS